MLNISPLAAWVGGAGLSVAAVLAEGVCRALEVLVVFRGHVTPTPGAGGVRGHGCGRGRGSYGLVAYLLIKELRLF